MQGEEVSFIGQCRLGRRKCLMTQKDDGLPDEASTQGEGSQHMVFRVPTWEEKFVDLLIEGCSNGGLSVRADSHESFEGASYELEAFDERPDEALPNLYLIIHHENEVDATELIEVLRSSRLPLLTDEGCWIAWDDHDERLRVNVSRLALDHEWQKCRLRWSDRSMDEAEEEAYRVLHRAFLSADPGTNPLLLHQDALEEGMHRREVDLLLPTRIPRDAIDRHALAYVDAAGQTRSMPLSLAARLGFPVCTRLGTYRWSYEGDLVPEFHSALLLAGAFILARSCNPNQFSWFICRERGSLFHPAIERIEAPHRWSVEESFRTQKPRFGHGGPTPPRINAYTADQRGAAHEIAVRISEWSSTQLGPVYLTAGEHPLHAQAVTTPELYEHAMYVLSANGYLVEFDRWSPVKVWNQFELPPRFSLPDSPIPF